MLAAPLADARQADFTRLELLVLHQLLAERGVLAAVLAGIAEAQEVARARVDERRTVDVRDEGVEQVLQPHQLETLVLEHRARFDRASRRIRLDAHGRLLTEDLAVLALHQIRRQRVQRVAIGVVPRGPSVEDRRAMAREQHAAAVAIQPALL
jgi:hypothetical protein